MEWGWWAPALALAAVALWRCLRPRPAAPLRWQVLVLVRDGEAAVEGFLRELFRLLDGGDVPEVAVLDQGAGGATTAIVERLGRTLPVRLASAGQLGGWLAAAPATLVLRVTGAEEARRLLQLVAALGHPGAGVGRGGRVTGEGTN